MKTNRPAADLILSKQIKGVLQMEAAEKTTVVNKSVLNEKRHKYLNKKFLGTFFSNGVCHVILIAIAFLILFPFVQKIAVIFQSAEDALDPTVQYIAKNPTTEPLLTTIGLMRYYDVLLRTFIFCGLVALAQTFSCTLVAYGFARFKFPFRGVLFGGVLLVLLVPPQVIMSALYLEFSFFDWFKIPTLITGQPINIIKTVWPFVILSFTALGFKNSLFIYLMRQFFRGLPTEIEEAGMIDGTSTVGIFFRLMIPNAIPMMVTIFLFSFSWYWTDYYYTGIFGNFTLLAQSLQGLLNYGANTLSIPFREAMVKTGIMLVILPLVFVYLIGQKFFVQGIARSGIVG